MMRCHHAEWRRSNQDLASTPVFRGQGRRKTSSRGTEGRDCLGPAVRKLPSQPPVGASERHQRDTNVVDS
ncbi:hypothetical protein PM082_013725 [Marasmius tenuissimus]|nr:hypothetical protein PM082_013725 [Marasmius tenuissimus]